MAKTKEIFKDLASCEPYRPANGLFAARARKLSRLLLALGALCLCLLVAFGFWYKNSPSTPAVGQIPPGMVTSNSPT